jgi:Tol biopolymer transport system component/DNA-binding winged helix-turn-helix (wHTH) protein
VPSQVPGAVYQFGDFRLDSGRFELLRNGHSLHIERKPMELLIMLASREGQLVTRADIAQRLWSSEVFVDTEHGINTAIRKIRQILRDDPEDPRFVQTVTGMGYRFIVPTVAIGESAADVQAAPVVEPATADAVDAPEAAAPPPQESPKKPLGAQVAVVVALCGAAAIWYLHRPLPPLRVTGYNPITRDNHGGGIAGTDGARIYFNSDDNNSAVHIVSVSGGETQKVPLAVGHVVLWDVSRDGSNLLGRSLEPSALWTVDVPGGAAHFITKVENSWSYRWSPDGKYIAYCDQRKGQEGLYVMGRDGADVHKIVTMKATDVFYDLAWSPDGSRIRFTDNNSLWEVSSAGTNLHPVFPKWKGPAEQCCGQWTPDGDFYLFIAGGSGDSAQIWALDERHRFLSSASPDPVPLTSGPIHWERPFPSKDGNKIFASGTIPRGELVRFDQTSKQLRPFLGGISAEFVAYSKDGAHIAYVTYPDGILWRAKADGTERIQLTNPPLYPIVCRWSPDGSQILFTVLLGPSRSALYVMPAQGGTPRLLLSGDDGQNPGDGVWSPDGRRVMYSIEPKNSLRILDLDSGKVSEVPGSNGLYSPRWSPNGRYVAALTRSFTDAGFSQVVDAVRIFDLQTQQWSTLAEHMGSWGFPTWSHDSKFLYALNFPADNGAVPPSVYRIAVPGGTPQRVVDLRDVPLIGAVNFWFGLDPDDTPLLLRDNGTNDIYALTLDSK